MNKIASPQELQTELRALIAYCEGTERPSRQRITAKLQELAHRVSFMGRLPDNNLMRFPSGRWGFVGHVDPRLAWETKSGDTLNLEQAKELSEMNSPAMFYRTRAYKTPLEAILAAKDMRQRVTISPGDANNPDVQEAIKKAHHPQIEIQK